MSNCSIEDLNSQEKREFKSRLYQQFARIASAAASPRRLELIDLLCQGERSVEALAAESQMSVASASQHLQVLYQARRAPPQRTERDLPPCLAGGGALVAGTQKAGRTAAQRGGAPHPPIPGGTGASPTYGQGRVEEASAARGRGLARRTPAARVRGGAHPGGSLHPDRGTGVEAGLPCSRQRDRGLLPRTLLPLRSRGRGPAAQRRLSCPSAGGRVAGVAGRRPAGRGRRTQCLRRAVGWISAALSPRSWAIRLTCGWCPTPASRSRSIRSVTYSAYND